MAISSSSFTLQNLSVSTNGTVSKNRSPTQNIVLHFRVSGYSESPKVLSYSARNCFNSDCNNKCQLFKLKCSDSGVVGKVIEVLEDSEEPRIDDGGDGNGGDGRFPPGGGDGGGEGGGGEGDDNDEKEFGPIMKFEDVMREAEMRGASLPADMIEAAKITGIRRLLLTRYLDLQVKITSFHIKMQF